VTAAALASAAADALLSLAPLAAAGADVTEPGPIWVQVLKAVVIFAVILQIVPMVLWAERRLLGRFQARLGPNRVGVAGLMQPLADVIKLVSKEASTPSTAVPWMMAIAPVISITTAVLTLAVIPFGAPGAFGGDFALAGIDVSIGLLYFFAFGSLAFYGLMLGGWASGSKYSFLGSMRAAAQLVSYEVAIGLSLLGVAMVAGSLSLVEIVEAQGKVWFIVPQIVGFLVFLVAGFAEASRPPFDLPEADAELVAGYNTEFGGMRFGSFFMAEYIEVVIISGVATALFLGGWQGPGPEWLGPLWVLVKMLAIVFLFIWVRATLPRLRYDQLMSLGWKVLLPLATLNVLVTAILVVAIPG
jgi:NADH-quinone oxidoreductase subunit H